MTKTLSCAFHTALLGTALVLMAFETSGAETSPPKTQAVSPTGVPYIIREKTDYIVVHCSDTPATMDVGAAEIRQWHTSKDPHDPSKPWIDIGYHYVIRRNGTLETGRPAGVVGSHAKGYNDRSVSVCLIGGKDCNNFTREQIQALGKIVDELKTRYPAAKVVGHHDLSGGKTCPQFDAAAWYRLRKEKEAAKTSATSAGRRPG